MKINTEKNYVKTHCKTKYFLKDMLEDVLLVYKTVTLLVCCFYDKMNCQAIFDAMLAEAVTILQDLPSKNQNQLVLLGFEPL